MSDFMKDPNAIVQVTRDDLPAMATAMAPFSSPTVAPPSETLHLTALDYAIRAGHQAGDAIETAATRFLHFIKTGSFDGAPK